MSSTEKMYDRAMRVIPGGVNSCRRKITPPLVPARGEGAYVYDVEGKRYVDYHCAYGAIFVGHADQRVNLRAAKEAESGLLFGIGVTEAEVQLSERIVGLIPSAELVQLCTTGTEANFNAIRLARGVTGRSKIIKFQGCYHGSHDYVLMNNQSKAENLGRPDPHTAGALQAAVAETLVCRFNDLDDVRSTLENTNDGVAAIIVEPVAHNSPSILPAPGFLQGLRDLADEFGALLIFDEVITGFRHAPGGYQSIAGVTPDLTAIGKAMGNGYAIAAVVGKREYMERFNSHPNGDVFFGGTYNGGTMVAAASLAVLDVISDPSEHERLFALGDRMRTGLEQIVDEAGIEAYVSGYGSIYCLNFAPGPFRSYEDVLRNDPALQVRYRRELIHRGILEMPEGSGRNHITLAHTEADIDLSLEAARDSLRAVLS